MYFVFQYKVTRREKVKRTQKWIFDLTQEGEKVRIYF